MLFCQGKKAGDLENRSQSFVRSRSYSDQNKVGHIVLYVYDYLFNNQ